MTSSTEQRINEDKEQMDARVKQAFLDAIDVHCERVGFEIKTNAKARADKYGYAFIG